MFEGKIITERAYVILTARNESALKLLPSQHQDNNISEEEILSIIRKYSAQTTVGGHQYMAIIDPSFKYLAKEILSTLTPNND